MALTRKNQPTASITAAVKPLNIRNATEAAAISQVSGGRKQREAWGFYESMSELNYPASYLGRNVARFHFPVGVVPADDLSSPAAVPEKANRDKLYAAAEQIAFTIRGEDAGLADLAEGYTKNMAVAGEGWFIGRQISGEILWSVFSVIEFGPTGSYGATGDTGQAYARYPLGNTSAPDWSFKPGYLRRIWQPSPKLREVADTPTFAVLDKLKTLAVLDRSLRARIVNSLTQSGFLFMPSQLSLAGPIGAPTGDGQAVEDPFAAKILSIIQAQHDSGDASATPALIRGDAALGEAIKFITMDRTIDRVELELRSEQRAEIAKGMFLPPEVIEGMGSANHWSSWSVTDSAFTHLLPYAQGFADLLTTTILWPLLRDVIRFNGWDYSELDIRRHKIIPDGSDVISRPNEAEDGRQLHDRMVISDKALRDRSAVGEGDEPSEEEYVRQVGRKINNPYLATYGLAVHDEIDWEAMAAVAAGPGKPGVGSTDEAHRPADSSDPAGAPGEGDTQAEDEMTARLLVAASPGFLLAARKKVGAKLRARCEPDKELHASLKHLPNEEIVGHPGILDAVGLSEGEVRKWFLSELSGIADAVRSPAAAPFIHALAAEVADGSEPNLPALAVTSVLTIRED